MAVVIMAIVITIIAGAHYFGRSVTRPVWSILSVLALFLESIAYRDLGI